MKRASLYSITFISFFNSLHSFTFTPGQSTLRISSFPGSSFIIGSFFTPTILVWPPCTKELNYNGMRASFTLRYHFIII